MKIVICEKGGWRLTPLCLRTYYAKKGIDCYCYRRKGAGDLSTKWVGDEYVNNAYYYSKDFGESFTWDQLMQEERIQYNLRAYDIETFRTDIDFIETVQELGDKASANETVLRIVDVPDDAEYEIECDYYTHYDEQIYIKKYL